MALTDKAKTATKAMRVRQAMILSAKNFPVPMFFPFILLLFGLWLLESESSFFPLSHLETFPDSC
jgi:hypothetical protein